MRQNKFFDLKNKIAVVTGGAGLIGKELVKGLAASGATAIVADIDKNKAKAIADKIKNRNMDVVPMKLDITREKSVSELIKSINKKWHRIDIWVNAAYPRTKDWGEFFENTKVSSWRKNVDMHLNGYFICCQKIAEYMKKQHFGSIINFGSTYGIVGPEFSVYKGTKMTMPGPYSAIKGGIINFTKYMASYYGKYDIRINCLSPGGVWSNTCPKTFVKQYSAKTPLKRMAKPDDIVGGVIYLASDAASYVTGHNLVIDGGWTAI